MGLVFAISAIILIISILFILSLEKPDARQGQVRDGQVVVGDLKDQYAKDLSGRRAPLVTHSVRRRPRVPPLEKRGLFRTVVLCVLMIVLAVSFKKFLVHSAVGRAMRRAVFGMSEEQYRDICLGHVKPAMEAAMQRKARAELDGDMDDPLIFEEEMWSLADRTGFLSAKALLRACERAGNRTGAP